MANAIPSKANLLPTLFLGEAITTFIPGVLMILFPTSLLKAATTPTLTFPLTPTTATSSAAAQLFQWTGVFFIILCVPLVLGAADNPRARASRKITYLMLGSGEMLLTGLMALQASQGEVAGGLRSSVLWGGSAMMASVLATRAWVLGFRSHWFEDPVGLGQKRRE